MSSTPPQQFSDDAANIAFVLALGIMAAVLIVLSVGIALAALYLKVTLYGVSGSATMLVLCLLSTSIPVGIALHFSKKIGTAQSH